MTNALRQCTDILRETDRKLTDLHRRFEARLHVGSAQCQERLVAVEKDLIQARAERDEARRATRNEVENGRASIDALNRSLQLERGLFAVVRPQILTEVWADRQKAACETLALKIDDAGNVAASGEVRDVRAVRDRLGAALRARQIGTVEISTDGLKPIDGCVKYLGTDKRFAIDQDAGRYRATYLKPLLEKDGRMSVNADGKNVTLAPSFLPEMDQCEAVGRLLEAEAKDVTVFFVRKADEDVGLCARTGDTWKEAGNRFGTQAYVVRQMGTAR